MSSIITNHYDPDRILDTLRLESTSIYTPSTDKDWTFAHQPHIASFHGKLYASWSNGKMNEDDLGQRVMMAVSEDFYHWSPPYPLLDSTDGKASQLVLSACGFHAQDHILTAYIGQFEYQYGLFDSQRMDMKMIAYTTTDGVSWQGPVDLGIPANSNHGPQRTSTGRLIMCSHIMYPYTDDPAGLTGWQRTGIYPQEKGDEIKDCFHYATRFAKEHHWPVSLTESSFYETDDGVIHMMLRSSGKFLWVTESTNDGATWSEPRETLFTDNGSRCFFGRLPDGQFYAISNADPGIGHEVESGPDESRKRLILSLSKDGYSFNRQYVLVSGKDEMQYPGKRKRGIYAYPQAVVHDRHLVVIYSIGKERISVVRVPLDQLA